MCDVQIVFYFMYSLKESIYYPLQSLFTLRNRDDQFTLTEKNMDDSPNPTWPYLLCICGGDICSLLREVFFSIVFLNGFTVQCYSSITQ